MDICVSTLFTINLTKYYMIRKGVSGNTVQVPDYNELEWRFSLPKGEREETTSGAARLARPKGCCTV